MNGGAVVLRGGSCVDLRVFRPQAIRLPSPATLARLARLRDERGCICSGSAGRGAPEGTRMLNAVDRLERICGFYLCVVDDCGGAGLLRRVAAIAKAAVNTAPADGVEGA